MRSSKNILSYPPHFQYTARLLESIVKFEKDTTSSKSFPTIPTFDLHGARLLKFAVDNKRINLRKLVKALNSNHLIYRPHTEVTFWES